MKKRDFIYITTILILIIMLLLFNRSCSKVSDFITDSDTTTTVVVEQHIIHDTTIKYVPKPYKVTYLDTVVILDSAHCLNLSKEFYSTTTYHDTLFNDSTLFFVMNESINQNKISSRTMDYKTFEKIVTIKETITNTIPPKEKINILMLVGMNRNLQTLDNSAFMDLVIYYKRVGITTGFTSDGTVKIGVGIKW